MNEFSCRRGDIFYADISEGAVGNEQGGIRPVVVVQNDIGNYYSPTVIVAPVTTRIFKKYQPTHVFIRENAAGLPKNSFVLLEQLRTIDKARLLSFVGHIGAREMQWLDYALSVSVGLIPARGKLKSTYQEE